MQTNVRFSGPMTRVFMIKPNRCNKNIEGGVIVGATADLMLQPYGAFTAGCVAGLVATFGYQVTTILNPF